MEEKPQDPYDNEKICSEIIEEDKSDGSGETEMFKEETILTKHKTITK